MSLICLSKQFQKNAWEVHFMIRDYQAAEHLAHQHNLDPCPVISRNLSSDEEVKAINEYVTRNNISHFFCCVAKPMTEYDGLHPDLFKGCVCVFNDGLVPKNWDLMVNWNFPDPGLYAQELFPRTRFLLGPEFVILPDNFDPEIINGRTLHKPIKNLLIAMGGADEHNLTTQVVRKILDEKLDLHLTLILGVGFRERDALDSVLQSAALSYECKTCVRDMFAEYMNCDAAIGAGGLTASELVATHTPALLIAAYEHQETRCRFFGDQGMAVYLGNRTGFLSQNLRESLSQLETFGDRNFSINFCGSEKIETHFTSSLS